MTPADFRPPAAPADPSAGGPGILRPRPLAVIDTNAVLDWLVFEDAHGRALGAAVERGTLDWIATPAMHDELAHVLARGLGDRWRYDAEAVTLRHRTLSRRHETSVPRCPLHSRDPDDQKFIDLALAAQTDWLVTRDRALLRLASRARAHGVAILTPAQWCRGHAGSVA